MPNKNVPIHDKSPRIKLCFISAARLPSLPHHQPNSISIGACEANPVLILSKINPKENPAKIAEYSPSLIDHGKSHKMIQQGEILNRLIHGISIKVKQGINRTDKKINNLNGSLYI